MSSIRDIFGDKYLFVGVQYVSLIILYVVFYSHPLVFYTLSKGETFLSSSVGDFFGGYDGC